MICSRGKRAGVVFLVFEGFGAGSMSVGGVWRFHLLAYDGMDTRTTAGLYGSLWRCGVLGRVRRMV
jgi:hypothetical protein